MTALGQAASTGSASAPLGGTGHPGAPHLVAINRFYRPDHAPTGQLLADLAEHLVQQGWRVTVLTSRMRYDDPTARLPARETLDGVEVRRLWTSRFGRHWLPGRSLDYLTFYLSALLALLLLLRRGDLLLAKTDAPLISVVASLAARLRGAALVNWCQDLFPEVAAALGMRWAAGPLGRILTVLRNRSLRSAALNIAICDGMAGRLEACGVPPARIAVLHNWADGRLIRPIPDADNPLRRAWGLEGRRVLGYSGNLGRAHDLPALQRFIGAMAAHDPDHLFLFIGGGAGHAELRRWAGEVGLSDRVHFQPYQPVTHLAWSLSLPDAHIVSLDPACEGLIMPSKLYGILAAGRPVVAVGDREGSLARLVRAHGLGQVWQPGGEREVLDRLAGSGDHAERARLRTMSDGLFGREQALGRWSDLLVEMVRQPAPARVMEQPA
jgi:hypothetical protein